MGRHGGETIGEAVAASSSPNVQAFFIMHSPPEVTAEALRELKNYTSLPLGAYAHGGGDRVQIGQAQKISGGHWASGTDSQNYLDYAREWISCGATIIGGCCGITPEHISALSEGLDLAG